MSRGREITAVVLAATVSLVAGCSEEQTLTASEFVDQVTDEGVDIRLERQLHGSEANELREVRLLPLPGLKDPEPAPEAHEEEAGHEHEHEEEPGASGTLYVFDDVDGANAELAGCRAAVDLTCYQAANIVVLFEESGIEVQRLGVAIQRMAD